MRPPGPTVQRGRFGFQFFIEVLSSAHAKTWIDCAAFWGGRGRSRKKGRAGYSGSRAIEDDDRAVCADTFARGSFGFVRRRSPSAGKIGGGREDRKYHFHAAILERGFGDVSRAAAGQDATGQRAAGLFLDQQGAVVRNRRVRRIFAGCSGTKTARSEFLSGKHDQRRIRDLGKNAFAGTKGAGRGIFHGDPARRGRQVEDDSVQRRIQERFGECGKAVAGSRGFDRQREPEEIPDRAGGRVRFE